MSTAEISNLTIKPATLADLNSVTELFEQYRHFYQKPAEPKQAQAFIKQRLANQDSIIIMAELDNQACGFVQLYPCFSSTNMQKMYILNDLFVHENYRKLTVATELMNAAKDVATANQAHSLKLCTAVDNHQAQALYKKLNYKKIESFEHYLLLL